MHSRGVIHGLRVANSTSVLIKFESLLEIERYIQVVYCEFKGKIQSYFQIYFINVNADRTTGLNILSYYQNIKWRLNYQNTSERINETGHNKYRERCKTKENDVFKIKRKKYINDKNSELCDTLEHEELKARKRKQHQTFLDNIRGSPKHQRRKEKIRIKKKNGLKNRVQAFKTQIQEGPFYVCIVGNRGIDRSSVCRFRFENCEILNERIIFCVHSHDGESYICVTCDQKKLRKMIFQAKHLPINLVLKNFQFSFRLFVGLRVLERSVA